VRLFSSANLTRDSRLSRFLITFFLSQQFEGARIAAEDLSFLKARPFVPQGIWTALRSCKRRRQPRQFDDQRLLWRGWLSDQAAEE
jgi:hypothetical protein